MCMGTVKLSELQQPTLSLFETFTVVPYINYSIFTFPFTDGRLYIV